MLPVCRTFLSVLSKKFKSQLGRLTHHAESYLNIYNTKPYKLGAFSYSPWMGCWPSAGYRHRPPPPPSIFKSFYTRSRLPFRTIFMIPGLRNESTARGKHKKTSQYPAQPRLQEEHCPGGRGGGGGAVEHIKIEKILHIPENQCTWFLIGCCHYLDLCAINNNHLTNFNSLDRMRLNFWATSSLIRIVKPCFYFRRP